VTVPDWLQAQARARADHPALVLRDGRRISYAVLERDAAGLAARLRDAGAAAGVPVGVSLRNGPALVTAILATPRTGAPLVLCDPRWTPAETARACAAAGVRVFIGDGDAPAGTVRVDPDGVGATRPAPMLVLDRPHTVVFTSGTTGDPKPVVLTASNHLWSALGSAARLGMMPDDRWLACLPLWHVGGLAVVLRSVLAGATVLLHDGFDVDAVARSFRKDAPTLVSLVPTALARLRDVAPPPSLRVALVGGAAATPDLLRDAAARGWPVAPTYGCTEAASQIATAAPGGRHALAGSVGLPLLPTRVRIVRSDGTPAAVDEDGEIQVQSPTVSPGRLGADGTLVPVVGADGWLRTNDIGRLAPDGALRVLGRRDDVIVTGGENVAPAEVEAVLAALPDVAEVAVAAVPDAEWGHAVAAWVVPAPGATPTLAGIRDAARAHLAPHKLPRRLFLVDVLPRTAAGKVRRTALRIPDVH
jgi:O-succinylbenzoic acid--CoA ligase